jgi:2-polyprenyl-6-methoxyphenol hydroxylase-like FAD-dependent oxidoreductase
MIETPVLIAGGGPVGLTLALELKSRGIRALLVEQNDDTTRHPKMDYTNARSMEHYHRLGVAELIKQVAVPGDNAMNAKWVSKLSEWELCEFRYASENEVWETIRNLNDGNQTRRPGLRLSQVVLEPVLKKVIEDSAEIDVRFGWAFTSFEQDQDGVTATITETKTGNTEQVRAQYLAGCDGAGSVTRKQLGIEMQGVRDAAEVYMVHIRSRDYAAMIPFGHAWHHRAPIHGNFISQDDDEIWTVHGFAPEGNVDPAKLLVDLVGREFDFEILIANPWTGHYLLADSYGSGRVWMAGDAVHTYLPFGGYGMNAGASDAVDLGWKLAAVLQGWGGPKLLASTETDRRPVAALSMETARSHEAGRVAIAQLYTPMIHADSPHGAEAREKVTRGIREIGGRENECQGVEYGYRYEHSSVICYENGEPPPFDHGAYHASTWPGSRAPSLFLDDGKALYDQFGPDFTLLNFATHDTSGFEQAARNCGMPFKILNISDQHARGIYERDMILVRPDQFIAWRGNVPPADPAQIIDKVRGTAAA